MLHSKVFLAIRLLVAFSVLLQSEGLAFLSLIVMFARSFETAGKFELEPRNLPVWKLLFAKTSPLVQVILTALFSFVFILESARTPSGITLVISLSAYAHLTTLELMAAISLSFPDGISDKFNPDIEKSSRPAKWRLLAEGLFIFSLAIIAILSLR